ncbi:U3 small nucleolar ribonucleoprotein protein IMP3, putative [Plasmodium gallinaceum]|uniref:U3 small nucleolar ribonucleoprotein protein IMP3, putative n=1 Tax=Plasmodium gallinaceum TaxID=5849 RepID=A0A1J1GUT8_PLAGA|nr:U3 small nucleolar ribonucleoprotein protein IMP3, putative [Plasmodium gallinaceum]CRG94809.1 U3 small nucleolar ribonucleoprotein protein IMP3, putative [Plasmodium gallinaceum]
MRKLKYHEQKLLKKVNLYDWKRTRNIREVKILRKYVIQNREDYTKYNKICGYITKLVSKLRLLPENDEFRIKMTDELLDKLYDMGLINYKSSLAECEKISVSSFCRRRLAVMLFRLKFVQTIQLAITYIQHGNIRVGNNVINNPSFHINRNLEDHIKWADGSKIIKHIQKHQENKDDYELLGN